ncbi:energy transducer TonB [Gluconobacter sphaericus]|uniref:energy transducer TonB n=1 Tax=Gluconobacter sphaericus TaxID=574987 RepID=UPI001B8C4F3F|nr:energy transducer TonB [Gluconobacter sphaericus]MBS1085927.1 energy transducer TonB [Gluconobacter sphaericus]MBS1099677.1 energy transducer TonB [Gluconobacter sphaericus]
MSDGLISANVPLPRFREWYAATCHVEDRRSARLWGGSALGVVALTGAALFWAVMSAHPQPILVAEPSPAAISIDLAPVPVPVSAPQQDVDPAPQQAVASTEPQPEDRPKVEAPPSPAPNPPVPVPKTEKVRPHQPSVHKPLPPVPVKAPSVEKATAPRTVEAPPTTAPSAASVTTSSQASHDPVTWQGELLARLERFKRYPEAAQSTHQEGTSLLHFVMDRKGHVLSVSLKRSAGYDLLDAETLALIHRAEPLPIPPDSVQGDPLSLTVPIEFYLEH